MSNENRKVRDSVFVDLFQKWDGAISNAKELVSWN